MITISRGNRAPFLPANSNRSHATWTLHFGFTKRPLATERSRQDGPPSEEPRSRDRGAIKSPRFVSHEALGVNTGMTPARGKGNRHRLATAMHKGGRQIRAGQLRRGLLSRSSALFGADWPARSAPRMNSSKGGWQEQRCPTGGADRDAAGIGRRSWTSVRRAAWRLPRVTERGFTSRIRGGESAAASGTENLAE
jgi:hypothetical protein